MVFVLLPAFAGIMMLAYRNRRMTYGEHLVFSLHLHAFWFLLFLAIWLVPESIAGLLQVIVPIYGTWAMREAYGGRWWRDPRARRVRERALHGRAADRLDRRQRRAARPGLSAQRRVSPHTRDGLDARASGRSAAGAVNPCRAPSRPATAEAGAAAIGRPFPCFVGNFQIPIDPGRASLLRARLHDRLRGEAGLYMRWIRAALGSNVRLLDVDEGVFFRADTRYTLVSTASSETLIRKSLHALRAELGPACWSTIHRSTIVNVRAINEVRRMDKRPRRRLPEAPRRGAAGERSPREPVSPDVAACVRTPGCPAPSSRRPARDRPRSGSAAAPA